MAQEAQQPAGAEIYHYRYLPRPAAAVFTILAGMF